MAPTQENTRIIERLDAAFDSLQATRKPVFRYGGSFRDIRVAESVLKVDFPKELVDILCVADGQFRHTQSGDPVDPLFPNISIQSPDGTMESGYGFFCGVAEILLETLAFRDEFQFLDLASTDDPDSEMPRFGPAILHDSYLVLSYSEWPTMICVDLRPPEGGRVGQIVAINEQPWSIGVLASILCEYFELLIDGYSQGRFRRCTMDDLTYYSDSDCP
jgi:cell wall assembly regulator SMI1